MVSSRLRGWHWRIAARQRADMTRIEQGLLVIMVGGVAVAAWGGFGSIPRVARVQPAGIARIIDPVMPPAESIDAAAHEVASTDPFRFDRRPTSVAYRPDLEGVAPPPKPPKPLLVLEGLVGRAA